MSEILKQREIQLELPSVTFLKHGPHCYQFRTIVLFAMTIEEQPLLEDPTPKDSPPSYLKTINASDSSSKKPGLSKTLAGYMTLPSSSLTFITRFTTLISYQASIHYMFT